jgi:isochorismate hydrolase
MPIKDRPFVSYFKRSGFKPIRDFIDSLTRQKKIMQKVIIKLTTARMKTGSVTYYIPVPTLHKTVEVSDADKALMKDFAETVKGHNENVLNQHREALKLISPSEEQDLSADFNAKSA